MAAAQKSIIEKLNLLKHERKLILHIPEDVQEFASLEYDSTSKMDQYDLVFIFIFELEQYTEKLKWIIDHQLLRKNGYVYFAYPKKNNPKYNKYIDRESMMSAVPADDEGYVFGSDIKFARMVSFNDVFTVVGLKSTPKKAASAKSSQCVDDYIANIEDIKHYCAKNEAILTAYSQLTFGYQKDWARYIYSAKREETREKRLQEMETVLSEGYKTIELYRRDKK